jgi:hypothetical protein
MKYPKRSQYKHAKQKEYRTRNWGAYNEALRQRGDLTVWFDEEAIETWPAEKTALQQNLWVKSARNDMAAEVAVL